MKLYFKDSQGEERFIAECEKVKDVGKEIRKFLDERSYRSYYTRIWGTTEEVTLDVGSHWEFFVVKGISCKDYIEGLQDDEQEEEYHQITFDEYLKTLQQK